jgi:hypothetical protein
VVARPKVISREYKIMLKASCFQGEEEQLLARAAEFWQDLSAAAGGVVLAVSGDLDEIKNSRRRQITFYDTEDCLLNNGSYVFRERRQVDNYRRQFTLKFRHLDRYISQARDMKARGKGQVATKFEEDIKPPKLTKLYSYSTSATEPRIQAFNNLGDIARLFPGLKKGLKSYDADVQLQLLNDLTVRELVITGAGLRFGKKSRNKAECALISWYDDACDPEKPLVVEFSFRFRDKRERYGPNAALRAYGVFQTLQKELPAWYDPDSMTKTTYAYSYAGCAGS